MSCSRFFLLCLCVLFSAVLSAQTYAVKAIVFSGYTAASQTDLLAASELSAAKPVSAADLQAAAQKLNDTGLFSRVNYKFDGQQLTFQLTPMDGLVPVLFDNFAWTDAGQIDSQLRAKLPLYKGSVGIGSGLERQVVEQLTALAAAKQLKASVTAVPVVDAKTGKTTGDRLRLTTPAVVVSALVFEGASEEQTKNLDAIAKAAVGQDYSVTVTAEELITAVVNVYRNQGFLDASVMRVGSEAPVITPDKIDVPLKVTVVEGGQYHVGKLTLAGSVLMTQEEFSKKVPLKPGDVASQEMLRRSLQMISGPYRSKGYLRARIKATPSPDTASHVVDYAIDVTPGDIFHLGKLDVVNLSDAQRTKFLAVWKMQAGDVFDASYPPQFLKKNAAALHELDGLSGGYKQYEHEDTQVVDLVVSFRRDAAN